MKEWLEAEGRLDTAEEELELELEFVDNEVLEEEEEDLEDSDKRLHFPLYGKEG